MILYTPLSESEVFPTNEEDYAKSQCISYEGRSCLVEQLDNGEYRLLQLLSTDPTDYLDAKFSPGSILK